MVQGVLWCRCHYAIHGGSHCTARRQVTLRYLHEHGNDAVLCEACYPVPRILSAQQLRETPCHCGCEVRREGPGVPPEDDATQALVEAYADQTITALSTGTSFAMGLDDESRSDTSQSDTSRPEDGTEAQAVTSAFCFPTHPTTRGNYKIRIRIFHILD